eukprot:XP_016656869.1 PREDICTED: tubulin polyglutamylase TTLL6-like [Acyrthosiphon pisum]
MGKKCSIQQLTEENETQKKGAICLKKCTYSIVREVAMTMGTHIVKPEESWDLWWCTTPMDFKKAKTFKKIPSKRITALRDWLRSEGYDVKKIWNEIDDVIIKTMILAYPFVNRCYQTCFSGHKYTPPCFEILGFDIILNGNCKPYLLEVYCA